MYRLLIVDDEADIADGLYEVFTERHYTELDVYKAYSAFEALELLNKIRIDIILMDIRMPGLSGLQLMEQVGSHWPHCKIIFLTGYNEFDYVYAAIRSDGVSYLLKTEGYDEIEKSVNKAISEIDKGLRDQELVLKAKEQLDKTIALLQREYLVELLQGNDIPITDVGKCFKEYQIPLNSSLPVLLLMARVDDMSQDISLSERHQYRIAIDMTVNRFVSKTMSCVFVEPESMILFWILQPKELVEQDSSGPVNQDFITEKGLFYIKEMLENIQMACNESLSVSVSFILNSESVELAHLSEKYYYLKKQLYAGTILRNGLLLTGRNTSPHEVDDLPNEFDQTQLVIKNLNKIKQLKTYLECGKKEEYFCCFSKITVYLRSAKSKNSNSAMQFYYSLALMLLGHVNQFQLAEKLPSQLDFTRLMRVDTHSSWSEAVDYLSRFTQYIFEIQKGEQEEGARNTVEQVKKYINDHLDQELSLAKLSEYVYFNPSYLSRLFKQVERTNLSDYIVNERIEKAKSLLVLRDMKINEIAKRVGYDTATSFSRMFKSVTDISPQEYKELRQNRN